MILAALSVVGGYVGVPHILGGANRIEQFLEPVFGGAGEHTAYAAGKVGGLNIITQAFALAGGEGSEAGSAEMTLMILSVVIAFIGIYIAYRLYIKNPELPKRFVERFSGLHRVVYNKYFVDEIYGAIFVRGLLGLGIVLKNFFDEIVIDGTINSVAALLAVDRQPFETAAGRLCAGLCLRDDRRRHHRDRLFRCASDDVRECLWVVFAFPF